LQIQPAQTCDILLVALRPVTGAISTATSPSDPVRVGAAWVDAASGNADQLLPIPSGLPAVGELRARARAVRDGAPTPTLAAVDLAERQTVAGGYTAPVRRQMIAQPYVTYGLLATFALIYIFEKVLGPPGSTTLCAFGALTNFDAGSCGSPLTWWRYVSSAFLHDNTSYAHILFNGLAMLWIGRLVEQLYGRLVLLGVFLITAVAGGLMWELATVIHIAEFSVSIGASGGISGLVGLLLMLGRFQGRNVPVGIATSIRNYALIVIGLNILFGFFFVGVNNFAHLGGVLAGAALGIVVPPLQHIGGRDLHSVEKGVLGAVIAVGTVALVIAVVHLAGSLPIPLPSNG
jgi:rhomboid protease GluP